jgi:hypothetical protein
LLNDCKKAFDKPKGRIDKAGNTVPEPEIHFAPSCSSCLPFVFFVTPLIVESEGALRTQREDTKDTKFERKSILVRITLYKINTQNVSIRFCNLIINRTITPALYHLSDT